MSLSLFRKKSFIGLDLGYNSIKAVQVERTSTGWKLSRVHSIPTPSDSIKDHVVVDPELVSVAIRTLLRNNKLHATSAVIGVAGGSVIVRNVRIPKMAEATLRKSIKFEAGRYVPSSIEDSFIEFEILGDAGENQMDVLIVASPREIVESRVRACEMAGLEVEVVDIDAFAMYRALVEADEGADFAESTIALVDIGATTTNVSVVSKGVFAMTRSIPQAGHTLTEALKTYFRLSDEDAESGKAQLNLSTLIDETKVIENPPLRVMQPHVDDLIREIRRSLNYYQSQQTESGTPNPVSHVIVSGGGSKLTGLQEYFAHKLGMDVARVSVLDNPRFTYAGSEEPGDCLELSVASGLAMRAFTKSA